jgi:polyribonucleotide nucleotidyltransferase
MVESEADILPEEVMLGAVVYGHEQMQAVITRSMNWLKKPASRNGTGRLRQERSAGRQAQRPGRSRSAGSLQHHQQAAAHAAHQEISDKAIEVLTAGEGAPDAATISNLFFDIEVAHRARPHPGRRAAHRRSRYAHRSPDRHPFERVAAHARFGAVYPR